MMTAETGLSVGFIRFIGVAEVLGAAGLILPGLFRIGQALTPVAAAGLVVIMIGATVISLPGGAAAVTPFVVGLLAACVAYARRRSLSLPSAAWRATSEPNVR